MCVIMVLSQQGNFSLEPELGTSIGTTRTWNLGLPLYSRLVKSAQRQFPNPFSSTYTRLGNFSSNSNYWEALTAIACWLVDSYSHCVLICWHLQPQPADWLLMDFTTSTGVNLEMTVQGKSKTSYLSSTVLACGDGLASRPGVSPICVLWFLGKPLA